MAVIFAAFPSAAVLSNVPHNERDYVRLSTPVSTYGPRVLLVAMGLEQLSPELIETILVYLPRRQDLSNLRLVDTMFAAAFTEYRGHLRRKLEDSSVSDVDALRFRMLARHRGSGADMEAARELFLNGGNAVEEKVKVKQRECIVHVLLDYLGATRLREYASELSETDEISEVDRTWAHSLLLESFRVRI